MKTNRIGLDERRAARTVRTVRGAGFTLIELLVVISVMAILAGFTVSVLGGVERQKKIGVATAELHQIESALDAYKAQYGTYPPSNTNAAVNGVSAALYSQLYYELNGVFPTNNQGTLYYVTLDNSAWIRAADVQTIFGVGGFVNCWKGSGDEASPSKNFLAGLRPNELASVAAGGAYFTNLVTTVRGPDSRYEPLGVADVNPFRYQFPGTNNVNSYDLWVQLVMNGKTNLICNWSPGVLRNNPAP